MGEPNFIVITGATSDTNDRTGLIGAMGDFAQECKDNGAMRITYGSVLSGKHPNALIFIQFFESLAGLTNYFVNDVIEKPSASKAPSNKAVIGRYILPKTIFSKLSKQKPGKGGEIHITDAIQSLIKENEKFIAHNFSGKYLDCGSMQGYINSTVEISKI